MDQEIYISGFSQEKGNKLLNLILCSSLTYLSAEISKNMYSKLSTHIAHIFGRNILTISGLFPEDKKAQS